MFRTPLAAGVLAVCLAATAPAQEWASKMFQETTHDFGSVARGAKAEFEFTFSNLYVEDVHVADVRSSCGCTSVRIKEPGTVKTYDKGAIVAKINTGTFLGSKGATITVTFDKPYYAQVELHSRVFIRSDVVLEPGSVELGTLDQGQAVDKTIAVSYAGREDWRVLEVKSGNPHITAKAVEASRGNGQVAYNLLVHVDDSMPIGYIQDHLMLVTNDGTRAEVPVPVEGQIRSTITVSPPSLFMGLVHPGDQVTKQLVVRGTQPFRITAIECEDCGFEFQLPKDQTPKKLYLIPVVFKAGQDIGKVAKTIRIKTDIGQPAPELSAYAVVSQ